MAQQLITLHIIDEGSNGGDSLFEVSLMLDDRTRESLRCGNHDEWREAMSRARRLIGDHVADRRPTV